VPKHRRVPNRIPSLCTHSLLLERLIVDLECRRAFKIHTRFRLHDQQELVCFSSAINRRIMSKENLEKVSMGLVERDLSGRGTYCNQGKHRSCHQTASWNPSTYCVLAFERYLEIQTRERFIRSLRSFRASSVPRLARHMSNAK
jgi:hypothetical protein